MKERLEVQHLKAIFTQESIWSFMNEHGIIHPVDIKGDISTFKKGDEIEFVKYVWVPVAKEVK